jgi:hypothetical protein
MTTKTLGRLVSILFPICVGAWGQAPPPMKRLLIVSLAILFWSSTSFAQTKIRSNQIVQSDNFTWTGQNSFLGYNFNKVLHVNATGPYTTIAAALNVCPSAPNGCHIIVDDGTSLTSVPAFSLGITPCQNYFAQVLELGVNTSISINGSITLNCGGYIVGNNRDGNSIITSGSFPATTSMVVMGDSLHSTDSRVEGVALNCNLVLGCSGISAQGLNENSTIGRVVISNYLGTCITVDGSSAPATTNYVIYDIDCQNGGSTNDAIVLRNTGTDLLQRITVVSNSATQSSGAGVHITGTGAGNFNGHTINTIHCEKHNDCVLMDGNQGATVTYADGENGVVNTVRMAASANCIFTGVYIRNNANSVSNPSIINQVTSTSITSNNPSGGIVPLYAWGINQYEWWVDNTGQHTPAIISTGVAFASLPGSPSNGTIIYCNNCTIANPCAIGGSGAIAKRLNGVWVCN